MHVVNRGDQWVWSMGVSIGGGFTGKLPYEFSSCLCRFLQPHSYFLYFF